MNDINFPLVWLDLEMTDLDPKKGTIIEIATVITNSKLEILAEGPDLVIHQAKKIIDNMGPWNQDHFTKSGLLYESKVSNMTLDSAQAKTLAFIKKYCPPQTGVLAGSSVHVDRMFLFFHMPKIFGYLHHHIIDVDVIRELALRWYPALPEYDRTKAHRAKEDIFESLAELKYYRENIFKNAYEN